jgi:hypothetical protein
LNPPRAPLAFRVGVVGHRPNRLKDADLPALRETLRTLLATVADEVKRVGNEHAGWFAPGTARLRAVSPLAEGVDRLFAGVALDLGFELCCVMPFAQEEFEKDFQPGAALEAGSLEAFRALLDRARAANALTCFELDGSRADEGAAYGAGGRVVANQSDLLVVVWDGERQGKRGGTEETFDIARRQGVPVIWVDAYRPHAWRFVDARTPGPAAAPGTRAGAAAIGDVEQVRAHVREALVVPQPGQSDHAHRKSARLSENPIRDLETFYAERQPRHNFAVAWSFFKELVGDGRFASRERLKSQINVTPFEQAVEKDWPPDQSTPAHRLIDRLRPYYAWPDKLAVIHSDCYRSAFVVAFLLAAAAVGLALFPMAARLAPHTPGETAFVLLELAVILAILGIVIVGRQRRWHERWIDYRLAAELVRTLRLVAPLGGARPFPQIPAHWASYGEPGSTWMAWYVRAVERDLGLPSARVEPGHVDASLDDLEAQLAGQIRFHEGNARRYDKIHHRLHTAGVLLIAATAAVCLLHLALPSISPQLTFFAAFFPALGAALAGIVNQGEFRRIARRSESMKDKLPLLLAEARRLRASIGPTSPAPAAQISVEAAALGTEVARALANEVLDWRVVVLDRPLEPPA